MSESEFDEILNDVRKRANANIPLEPPATQGISSEARRYEKNRIRQEKKRKKKRRTLVTAAVIFVIIIAVVSSIIAISGSKKNNDQQPQSIEQVNEVTNPLTGEAGYNEAAVGKRPVSVVVENEYSTEAVRPQWGIGDADIVFEGESEYSTRLLLIWADYTAVPDMVGPTRSARPPFIRFSQLFDSVFIHAGLSKSKGAYIGADYVFDSEDVDHINLLNLTEDGVYFGRNNERNTSMEHTGYLNGSNLPKLLNEKGIDMSLKSEHFTSFSFNKEAQPLSDITATSCAFRFSGSACPKKAYFTYDEYSQKYVTTDFDSQYGEANVKFENLIFLFDETEYIVKEDYKNGQSETYCNYKLSGGKATVLSQGTAIEASWGITDGMLWLKSANGNDIALNKGKSYIGYGSSNNGGSIELNVTPVNE